MKRAALLHCVALDAPRFKLLQQRDQLPFTGQFDAVRGWTEFTLQDAFLLRLMVEFTSKNGLPPSVAKSIFSGIKPHVHNVAPAEADIWFGEVHFGEAEFVTFHGTAFELAERLNRTPSAVGVIVANASRAARFVLERARALGLPEAD